MGLDIWFREDIVRILRGISETLECAMRAAEVSGDSYAEGYRRGHADAIAATAECFGVGADIQSRTYRAVRGKDDRPRQLVWPTE